MQAALESVANSAIHESPSVNHGSNHFRNAGATLYGNYGAHSRIDNFIGPTSANETITYISLCWKSCQ